MADVTFKYLGREYTFNWRDWPVASLAFFSLAIFPTGKAKAKAIYEAKLNCKYSKELIDLLETIWNPEHASGMACLMDWFWRVNSSNQNKEYCVCEMLQSLRDGSTDTRLNTCCNLAAVFTDALTSRLVFQTLQGANQTDHFTYGASLAKSMAYAWTKRKDKPTHRTTLPKNTIYRDDLYRLLAHWDDAMAELGSNVSWEDLLKSMKGKKAFEKHTVQRFQVFCFDYGLTLNGQKHSAGKIRYAHIFAKESLAQSGNPGL